MKYDIFFSISQTEVDGQTPSTRTMFENFFDQIQLAEDLEFGTAWVAETHLSCQTQKKTSLAVVPEFKGEIGLNTDICQLAHVAFSKTKKIALGSAIRNILCNGGPIAHAESIKSFLALNQMTEHAERKLEIGFAAGRFDFSNAPYGIFPKSEWEMSAWHTVKSRILEEASEVFLRLLRGGEVSSHQIKPKVISKSDFKSDEDWEKVIKLAEEDGDFRESRLHVQKRFDFEILSLIPLDVDMSKLQLTVGSHDPRIQTFCNEILPTRVFNLSITPPKVIEETHERMKEIYNHEGGPWRRWYMPRTAMIFMDDTPGSTEFKKNEKARAKAKSAWENYWRAMNGTIDQSKVDGAVDNTIYGSPEEVAEKICQKYHPHDRLMLWFDFNNHDNEDVKTSMQLFREKVVPLIESYGKD